MLKVVFVCSANICRSPMAEKLFLHEARTRELRSVALSMGVMNLQGRSAPPEAVAALEEVGLDLSHHRSQGVHPAILAGATHILVMSDWHIEQLLLVDRAIGQRAVKLATFDPEGGDTEIDDPIGKDLAAFRVCRDRLTRCIRAMLDQHVARSHT